MPELLDSQKSALYIEKIITSSRKELVLMLPLFRLQEKLFTSLEDASSRDVKITIIFGMEELELSEKIMLSGLKNIRICNEPHLKARCYFNENMMIFTSLDLHRLHEINSGEMSILINRENDGKLYEDAAALYETLLKTSIKILPEEKVKESRKEERGVSFHGFCIRCAMPVSYNPQKPYCRQCLNQLNSELKTPAHENYCHSCAEKASTGINAPFCSNCSN